MIFPPILVVLMLWEFLRCSKSMSFLVALKGTKTKWQATQLLLTTTVHFFCIALQRSMCGLNSGCQDGQKSLSL